MIGSGRIIAKPDRGSTLDRRASPRSCSRRLGSAHSEGDLPAQRGVPLVRCLAKEGIFELRVSPRRSPPSPRAAAAWPPEGVFPLPPGRCGGGSRRLQHTPDQAPRRARVLVIDPFTMSSRATVNALPSRLSRACCSASASTTGRALVSRSAILAKAKSSFGWCSTSG